MTDEIFGPVVSVFRFKDEAEALEIANNTEYGLSGSILDARCRKSDSSVQSR